MEGDKDNLEMDADSFGLLMYLIMQNKSDEDILNFNAFFKPYPKETIKNNLLFIHEMYRLDLKNKLLDEFDIDLHKPIDYTIL